MYTNVSMYYPCMFITRGRIIRKCSEKRIIDSLTILANIIFRTKVIFHSPLDNRRTRTFFFVSVGRTVSFTVKWRNQTVQSNGK